jgi:aminomethyltransferase
VINAGCADKDIAHLKEQLAKFKSSGGNAGLEVISDKYALLALQGPSAAKVLQGLAKEDLKDFYFMHSRTLTLKDVGQVRAGRSGYTGEDGFEVRCVVYFTPHKNNTLVRQDLCACRQG